MIDSVIGRERELEILSNAIEQDETVIIAGVSGVGKSSLARELLRRLKEQGRAVRDVTCFGESLSEVARKLAGADLQVDAPVADLLAIARTKASNEVLLLDDLGFSIEGLRSFLDERNGATVITTNREVDAYPVLTLRPFEVDDDAERQHARAIFNSSMKATNLAASDAEPGVVDAIARRLGGHPISLALAGRRAATLSPGGVLELLDDMTSLHDPSRHARHQTPVAAVRFTWDGLEPAEQRMLFKLARLGRPVSPAELVRTSKHPSASVLETLHGLVSRGLVHQGDGVAPLELFGDAAVELLPDKDRQAAEEADREVIEEAIARARKLPRGYRPFDFVTDDYVYWDAALWRCQGHRGDESAELLTAWLSGAFASRDVYDEAFDWERVDNLLEDVQSAEAWLQAAAAASPQLGDRVSRYLERVTASEPDTEIAQGARALRLGLQFEEHPRETFEAFANFPHDWLWNNPLALYIYGLAAHRSGASGVAREAFAAAVEHPATSTIVSLRARLGCIALSTDLDLAESRAESLIEQIDSLGPSLALGVLKTSAFLSLRRAEYDRAVMRLQRALEIAEGFSYHSACAARLNLGFGQLAAGQPEKALANATQLLGEPHLADATSLHVLARWQVDPEELALDWADLRGEVLAGDPNMTLRLLDIDMVRTAESASKHVEEAPEGKSFFDAILLGTTCQSASEVIDARDATRQAERVLQKGDVHPYVVTCFRWWLHNRAEPLLVRMAEIESAEVVTFLSEAGLLWVGRAWHALDRFEIARRILKALIEHDEPLDYDTIGAILYDDEFVEPSALKNRIDVQMTKLRGAGLKPYIAKNEKGFVLGVEAKILTSSDEANPMALQT